MFLPRYQRQTAKLTTVYYSSLPCR
uniref:Uncharacterized protein n=1 Tax=Arundo donax TaxID=35708 RepID=A0A0A9FUI8_ARUDO